MEVKGDCLTRIMSAKKIMHFIHYWGIFESEIRPVTLFLAFSSFSLIFELFVKSVSKTQQKKSSLKNHRQGNCYPKPHQPRSCLFGYQNHTPIPNLIQCKLIRACWQPDLNIIYSSYLNIIGMSPTH